MSEETATLESVEEIGLQEIFVANKEQDEQPTGVQEIFSVCNGTHTEPGVLAETLDVGDVTTEPNIVSETLHVIAMSEDSTSGSSEAVYVGNDIEGTCLLFNIKNRIESLLLQHNSSSSSK